MTASKWDGHFRCRPPPQQWAARGSSASASVPVWLGGLCATWATCPGRQPLRGRVLRGAMTAWPPRRTARTPPMRPPATHSLQIPLCHCTHAIHPTSGAGRRLCNGQSKLSRCDWTLHTSCTSHNDCWTCRGRDQDLSAGTQLVCSASHETFRWERTASNEAQESSDIGGW